MLHAGAQELTTPFTHEASARTGEAIARESSVLAHNYHPLPVVAKRARAQWVWDVDGAKYLDCLAAYSALTTPSVLTPRWASPQKRWIGFERQVTPTPAAWWQRSWGAMLDGSPSTPVWPSAHTSF